MSRRCGGIHFEQGDLNGRTLGAQVGSQAWAKAQTYFNGSAGQAGEAPRASRPYRTTVNDLVMVALELLPA
jgi:hypothetical protein